MQKLKISPLLLVDFYKSSHSFLYPDGTSKIYSNFTPRKSRMPGVDKVVVFGIQYLIKEYLIYQFNTQFFDRPLKEVLEEYTRQVHVDTDHIEHLHKLGYLPIKIKSLPEGTLCPIGVPCFTITTTDHKFDFLVGWITNYLETLTSTVLWDPITSATISHQFKKLADRKSVV